MYFFLKQLVEKGLIFPNKIEISAECKNLIQKIMTPERYRPKVTSILLHSWMMKHLNVDEQVE